jgi:hypothetical protein
MTSDGAAGSINATESTLPRNLRQRCLIHRCRELLAKVPAQTHTEIRDAYWRSSIPTPSSPPGRSPDRQSSRRCRPASTPSPRSGQKLGRSRKWAHRVEARARSVPTDGSQNEAICAPEAPTPAAADTHRTARRAHVVVHHVSYSDADQTFLRDAIRRAVRWLNRSSHYVRRPEKASGTACS